MKKKIFFEASRLYELQRKCEKGVCGEEMIDMRPKKHPKSRFFVEKSKFFYLECIHHESQRSNQLRRHNYQIRILCERRMMRQCRIYLENEGIKILVF